MSLNKEITSILDEIIACRMRLSVHEHALHQVLSSWLEKLSSLKDSSGHFVSQGDEKETLAHRIITLFSISGSPRINSLVGKAISLLFEMEWRGSYSKAIMRRLLDPVTADRAEAERKRILVVNPSTSSTRVACFEGIEKIAVAEIHLSPDDPDNVDTRAGSILAWLAEKGMNMSLFDGIACRSGFLKPVPTGTYPVVSEMLTDLEHPRIDHPFNISIPVAMKLAEAGGRGGSMLLTTSDPFVSDEVETVERLTGFIKVKRSGTDAHYLDHKAIQKILASMLGIPSDRLGALTVHMGNGISIALHREGRVTSVADAFSGVPSTRRSGPLDILPLIEAMKRDEINIKEIETVMYSRGGLFSLAGTDDFRSLDGFLHKGATEKQKRKIELIFDFFARSIAAAALRLTADGKPVDIMALSGGILRSEELVKRIVVNIADRYPLVLIPNPLDLEALAAGHISGMYNPGILKDYVRERDTLRNTRDEEDHLIDTTVFERKIRFRKKDAPILSADNLIDAACITVRDNFLPTIAIIGADNEEAILAARKANEEGSYRIAKFKLVGDYTAINQIAYDFDLVIDNDNFTIIDTDNPVEEANGLIGRGEAHILMKGKLHTDQVLRGVFHFLKSTGRFKKGELMSHVFVMDIPVRNKLLLISDAAVNTYPDVDKRIRIIENALTIANNLNIKKPKVAVISAIENVNPSVESSIEAGHIAEHFTARSDCIVEGPLSFDVAMDQNIALEKHYGGTIRGNADILIMPDIDAGNVLYKSLTTQSGATSAGVILCGDMPLILTSRGDSARSKHASISLAVKLYFDLAKNR